LIDKHKKYWRAALLVLLLAAFIGPWAFDPINVPAEYPCSAPFVRLGGDFADPRCRDHIFSWEWSPS
jgi:hypothetical protein